MSKSAFACAVIAPPVDPAAHRRIRLRRLGLQGAVARAVAELAFGEPRDALVVATVSNVEVSR